MAVTTTKTNKPLNPRGNDQSPKGYNRAELYTGKALDFDGTNDILTMPTALTSSLSTTTITHVLNFKTDFSSFASTRDDVFTYAERGVIFSFNNGTIYIYYRHNLSSWGNFKIPIDKVKLQEWNHCVIVIDYDNDFGAAYINGQEVVNQSGLTGASIDYNSNALTIGAQSGNRFFDGQLSGFKIFNTALTAAQVADLYNNPEKIVPTGVADSALKLWLPMMEGAGTTAYDGSGNGNHGTISGATWTHGIGAPVAQTAVIDWNKGQNIFTYSEDFTQWGNARTTDTANATTAPDGSDNAIKLEQQSGQTNAGSIYLSVTLSGGNDYQMSVFAKAAEKDFVVLYDSNANRTYFNVSTGVVGTNNSGGTATIEALANDWYKCTITYTEPSTGNANVGYYLADTDNSTTVTDSGGLYLWGPSIALEGKNNSYLPTYGTIQNSDVLLPQGLTTGRDITGVNLFENVRKQGALNLDGNSWAEVHDNASLDLTDGITVEAWVNVTDTSSNKMILSKWSPYADGERSYLLYQNATEYVYFSISKDGTNSNTISSPSTHKNDWFHFVGTYDGANQKLYVNGSQVATAALTGDINVGTFQVEIGRHQGDTSAISPDSIAQPRIYNRALSAEEVERNFTAGKYIYTND